MPLHLLVINIYIYIKERLQVGFLVEKWLINVGNFDKLKLPSLWPMITKFTIASTILLQIFQQEKVDNKD